jgi:hypothetical protein
MICRECELTKPMTYVAPSRGAKDPCPEHGDLKSKPEPKETK